MFLINIAFLFLGAGISDPIRVFSTLGTSGLSSFSSASLQGFIFHRELPR
jgi:hypothetical protein